MIFTPGKISDINETKIALEKASSSPLSVVIIGMGNLNFNEMRLLTNKVAGDRDVATFVPFQGSEGFATNLFENVANQVRT